MQKFTKADRERIEALRFKLRDKADEIDAMSEPLAEMVSQVNDLIREYNEIVTEANGVLEDITSEVTNAIDEKSERWQESERGEAIISWRDELENAQMEEVEEIEVPAMPTLDHDGQLENVPEEASL
jgi:hypothetical protein